MINLINGDCLEENKQIESGSVDLILTDLPYGTMSMEGTNHGMTGKVNWDNVIDTDKIMQISNRILRKNGKMVLFSQDPFSMELKNKAIPNLPYCYSMIWEKDHFANALNAKKAPVSYIEDILVFSKSYDTENLHPLRDYFFKEKDKTGLKTSEISLLLENQMGGHYFTKGIQFAFPNKKDYVKLQTTGFFKRPYEELQEINNKYLSTFNLWQGGKYKSNILKYKKDYNGYHPTQKPVLLLEDLIKTFSNENDLVVDLTMGSGSTMVACKNTNRNGIGIEKEEKYYKTAQDRIKELDNNLF